MMKIKLRPKKPERVKKAGNSSVILRKIKNPTKILSYLERERVYCAVPIAHLEPDFFDLSDWFTATNGDSSALCLISKSMSPPFVFTLGDTALLDSIFASVKLPRNAFITCQPRHLEAVEGYYDLTWRCVMKRMVVTRESFSPVDEPAVRLRPVHVRALNRFYRWYGSGFIFDSSQIRRGKYYGIWDEDRMVAVAGTHIISPTHGIAYLGNVLTHPGYRNKGLAKICCSAVTSELLDYCSEVVLNVEPNNLSAIRAYGALGYRDDCMMLDAFGRREGFIGAIITYLSEKLGAGEKYSEGVEVDG